MPLTNGLPTSSTLIPATSKDDDAQDIKADKLMKLLQKSKKKENENRRSRGVTELHIDG